VSASDPRAEGSFGTAGPATYKRHLIARDWLICVPRRICSHGGSTIFRHRFAPASIPARFHRSAGVTMRVWWMTAVAAYLLAVTVMACETSHAAPGAKLNPVPTSSWRPGDSSLLTLTVECPGGTDRLRPEAGT
jgi:hypothetical protein